MAVRLFKQRNAIDDLNFLSFIQSKSFRRQNLRGNYIDILLGDFLKTFIEIQVKVINS